ncbi:hypothetical protein [Streptomyces noursei]|nr:hypothetical protein [Streptomyces noursei]MCZ0972120.1 hypothetical protein [Streptomyces noursei]
MSTLIQPEAVAARARQIPDTWQADGGARLWRSCGSLRGVQAFPQSA